MKIGHRRKHENMKIGHRRKHENMRIGHRRKHENMKIGHRRKRRGARINNDIKKVKGVSCSIVQDTLLTFSFVLLTYGLSL